MQFIIIIYHHFFITQHHVYPSIKLRRSKQLLPSCCTRWDIRDICLDHDAYGHIYFATREEIGTNQTREYLSNLRGNFGERSVNFQMILR